MHCIPRRVWGKEPCIADEYASAQITAHPAAASFYSHAVLGGIRSTTLLPCTTALLCFLLPPLSLALPLYASPGIGSASMTL